MRAEIGVSLLPESSRTDASGRRFPVPIRESRQRPTAERPRRQHRRRTQGDRPHAPREMKPRGPALLIVKMRDVWNESRIARLTDTGSQFRIREPLLQNTPGRRRALAVA